jgi:hypothetical protein
MRPYPSAHRSASAISRLPRSATLAALIDQSEDSEVDFAVSTRLGRAAANLQHNP